MSISHIIASITTMNQFPQPSLALDNGVPCIAHGLASWVFGVPASRAAGTVVHRRPSTYPAGPQPNSSPAQP